MLTTERYDPSLPLAFTIAAVFEQTIEDIFLPGTDVSLTQSGNRDTPGS